MPRRTIKLPSRAQLSARPKRKRSLAPNPCLAVESFVKYLTAIGAEERNFKKYVITGFDEDVGEGKRYRRDLVTIHVTQEGDITSFPKGHEPDADEQAEIKAEFEAKKIAFPKLCLQTTGGAQRQRRELNIPEEDWFAILADTREQVICCQARVEKDAKRDYIWWSFWNDNVWRPQRPDVELYPLWKPDQRYGLPIMVHEGARAARFCDWLVNAKGLAASLVRQKHPWYDYLKGFEHWGWIGGALNPDGTDWQSVVKACPDSDVIIACDKDIPGNRAGSRIAYILKGHNIYLIMFDDTFPKRFKLDEPIPSEMFDDKKKYIGLPLEDFICPAILATEEYTITETVIDGRNGQKKEKITTKIRLRRQFLGH